MAYVLIIDDDADFTDVGANVLRNDGHEVEVLLNTNGAVEKMARRRPDLVVLDVMFPENSSAGFEIARIIRHENELLKGIPVLMVTAVNAKFPLGFAARDIDDYWLPISDFLEKPVDLDVLRRKVAALLQQGAGDHNRDEP